MGHDERPLTFEPCGRIGTGAHDRERLWDLRAVDERLFVEIFAHHEKTLAVEWTPEGHWRGRWVVHEKMAVELLPHTKVTSLKNSFSDPNTKTTKLETKP